LASFGQDWCHCARNQRVRQTVPFGHRRVAVSTEPLPLRITVENYPRAHLHWTLAMSSEERVRDCVVIQAMSVHLLDD